MKLIILGKKSKENNNLLTKIISLKNNLEIIQLTNLEELNNVEDFKYSFLILTSPFTLKDLEINEINNFINGIEYREDINIEEILLRYLIIESTMKELLSSSNKIKNIILFGSVPTLDISKKSDIDLYIVSEDRDKIYEELSRQKLDRYGKLGNKIYFYVRSILVEIYILDEIEDIIKSKLCYNGNLVESSSSMHENIKRFVILYGDDCSKCLNRKENYQLDIEGCFDEFKYFYYSLDNLKEDPYKFEFHYFIMMHNYIKIKNYMKSGHNYGYLPKNALNLLNLKEKEALLNSREFLTNTKSKKLEFLFKEVEKYQEGYYENSTI